ncbi:MAG: PAS domain S-box protein [Anaerolineaceae bacterium]|nr:PAS domain S-box protein [Anaerolineaceae bacterium]
MSLRRTTIITVFLTFLLLVVVLTISLQMVFSRHFQYEESQQNILNMQRVQAAFDNNYILLNYLAKEWANLPEIRTFMNEGSEEFLQRHVQTEILQELNLDAMLILNADGETYFGGVYDFENESFVNFDQGTDTDIKEVFQVEESASQSTNRQGIMVVEDQPLLMVSKPIYINESKTQILGQVILGRFFDDADIQALARQVKFPIEIGLVSADDLTSDLNIARNYFLNNNEDTYMLPVSEFHIAGFILIDDLKQQPALILRAEQYRYVARNADVVLRYMLLALIVSATVFAAIIFGGIEQTVLSRLSRLTREVQVIAVNPLESRRVTVDRKDEIASVGADINRMLDALETSQQERNALQQQIVGIVESVEDIIFTIDADLSKLQFFGTHSQQLGLRETDLSDEDNIPIYLRDSWPIHREAAQRVIRGEHLMYESSTRFEADTFIYQISMSPMRDKTGKITGIVGVGRDISQTKQMEMALQERYEEMRVLLDISQLFLKQTSLAETQQAMCEIAGKHFGADVSWLGERNLDGKMIPIAAYGVAVTEIIPVTIFEHLLHNYSLKPVFVISSLDLYGRFEEDIFYAIVIPLHWGLQSQVLYLYVHKMPFMDEQKKHFATSLGSLGELVLSNTRLLNEVKTSQENLQELSHQLVRVHEEERRNLARELHDEIGQYLTALKLRLSNNNNVKTINMEQLEQAQALVNELINKVRKMSLDLRPSMLDDLGLKPALDWYLERYTQQTGIQVDFDPQELEQKRFSSEVEITIFRIVQESLTNVARHAGVKKVYVQLVAFQDTLELMIEDEGIGFALEEQKAGSSSGLTGMSERTRLLQGEMEIQTMPGKGTRILVRLPLKLEETS